jgi:hypothetical protein
MMRRLLIGMMAATLSIAPCCAQSKIGLARIFGKDVVFTVGNAPAATYETARGLYRDCNAAPSGGNAPSRHQRCAEYLEQMLDVWNLDQAPGVCSHRIGDALPHAYVKYWRKRGLGFLSGEFRSAESSAIDFFNSQKRRCPTTGQR